MNELIQLIQEADVALVQLEQAKQAVETAKTVYETSKAEAEEAKAAFDLVVSKADDHGIPRAKLKKLAEERGAALMASGIIGSGPAPLRIAKPARKKKAEKAVEDFHAAEESPEQVMEV